MTGERSNFGLVAIGDALVDIAIFVSDEEFAALGYERGTQSLIDQTEKLSIESRFAPRFESPVAGGTEGHSARAFAKVGGRSAIVSCVGIDQFGDQYIQSMTHSGVTFLGKRIAEKPTGVCFAFITEDGERTMRTFLGASKSLDCPDIESLRKLSTQWISFSGFQLQLGGGTVSDRQGKFLECCADFAERCSAPTVLSCGARWVVEKYAAEIKALMPRISLLVGNAVEISALADEKTLRDWVESNEASPTPRALEVLRGFSEFSTNVVMTAGARGAFYLADGELTHIPTSPKKFRNSTSAGDVFLGAFLFYLSEGQIPTSAIERAHQVVQETLG